MHMVRNQGLIDVGPGDLVQWIDTLDPQTLALKSLYAARYGPEPYQVIEVELKRTMALYILKLATLRGMLLMPIQANGTSECCSLPHVEEDMVDAFLERAVGWNRPFFRPLPRPIPIRV